MLFRSKLRLSGFGVVKPHYRVKPGDVLTFPQARHIRVVKVLALGSRRGPASEAQDLYEDLKPPAFESRLPAGTPDRSEEHTSELQSLMRTSYAVFCLKKKNKKQRNHP